MERFLYIESHGDEMLIPLRKIRGMGVKSKQSNTTLIWTETQVTWTADHSIGEIAEAIYLTPPDQPLIRVSQKPFTQKQGAT